MRSSNMSRLFSRGDHDEKRVQQKSPAKRCTEERTASQEAEKTKKVFDDPGIAMGLETTSRRGVHARTIRRGDWLQRGNRQEILLRIHTSSRSA